MYYNAYAHENAAYTIAMAPCPYVYAVIAKRAIKDPKLNKDSITAKWFDFIVLKWIHLLMFSIN